MIAAETRWYSGIHLRPGGSSVRGLEQRRIAITSEDRPIADGIGTVTENGIQNSGGCSTGMPNRQTHTVERRRSRVGESGRGYASWWQRDTGVQRTPVRASVSGLEDAFSKKACI